MEAGLVVNPAAGKGNTRRIERITHLLAKELSLRRFVTGRRGDATSFARELRGTDLIVVAGGDGTINEVINGLLDPEAALPSAELPPLALIPLGTANVLARELGIPLNAEDALRVTLTGTARKISLGRINGRYFSLMAGMGFDGETVYRLNSAVKRIIGKGAYLLSSVLSLTGYDPPVLHVRTAGGSLTGCSAIIGNARTYGGVFEVTPRADLSEPLLDLCLFRGNRRMDIVRYVFGFVWKRHLRYHDVHYEKGSSFEITSGSTVHIQVDGDYFGTLPARIDVVGEALRIIC